MEDIKDVIAWFDNNPFIINPLITIALIGGAYYGAKILAVLINEDKNDRKISYLSKSQYISYLKE